MLLATLLALALLPALCAAAVGDTGTKLQGYTFASDVAEHAKIDLDQKMMETTTDNFKWSDANAIYSNGKHSSKSTAQRTLKGFSTSAAEKMKNEGYFQLFQRYWNDPKYADSFVSQALDNTGPFKGKPDIFRAECANKGSQYQNVWMYVIHEMEDAIDDCKSGTPTNNDKGVEAWDEAWAFYAGSLAGPGNGDQGVLQFSLAQKRCANFGTCTSGTKSIANVNSRALSLFNSGQTQLKEAKCDAAVKTKNEIVKLMTVPLIQGVIRYVYQAKNAKGDKAKEHAEGWAFAAAILPLVANCDRGVAQTLRKNFAPDVKPMSDGTTSVVNKLTSVYKCLGFTCADVGKLESESSYPNCKEGGSDFKVVKGTDRAAKENTGSFEAPTGSPNRGKSSGRGSTGRTVGIVIGVVVALVAIAAAIFFLWKRWKKPKVVQPVQQEGDFA